MYTVKVKYQQNESCEQSSVYASYDLDMSCIRHTKIKSIYIVSTRMGEEPEYSL